MSEKVIRDPVHDVIAFRMDRPVEALLFRLLNSAEVQRLRRIRQLGMAHLAYPGADHSRYSHSLGVMETARKMLDRLRQVTRIDEEMETVCLCAALLHDLGHGPFSHVFERVTERDHETVTRQIIENHDSEVHRLLAEHERELPQRVVKFMRGEAPRRFYCDVHSSQLDADRLDYLLRDNLMTGARYGDYDLGWLLHALTIDESSGRLAVAEKALSAVEAYLQARYHMYRNVYFHKVVRSAEGMLKLALQRARRLLVQGRLKWPPRESWEFRAMVGMKLSIAEFTLLDDVTVLHCFKIWSDADDPVLAKLCRALLLRRLFKSIDLSHAHERQRLHQISMFCEAEINSAGGEPDYEMFLDEPTETPYEIMQEGQCGGAGEVLVVRDDGKSVRFASISTLPQALNRQLMFRRLHFSEEFREQVMRGVELGQGMGPH